VAVITLAKRCACTRAGGISNAAGTDPKINLQACCYLPNRKATNFSSIECDAFLHVTHPLFANAGFDDKYAFTNIGFMQYCLT